MPLGQNISSPSTALLHKIYRKEMDRYKSLKMSMLQFGMQARWTLLAMGGTTEHLYTTLVRLLLRDFQARNRDMETLERDLLETRSHIVTPFSNMQEKPAFRDTEIEHPRRSGRSITTKDGNVLRALALARILDFGFRTRGINISLPKWSIREPQGF